MKCKKCGYEWKTRKEKHRGQWHCPKCSSHIKNICPNCGNQKEFRSKYCKDCYYKFATWDRKQRLGVPLKNGFYITNQPGSRTKYKMVLMPSHPRASRRANYVAEHILMWEREHNRYLPEGYTVHHKDGNGLNNTPSNLIALKHHGPWILYHIACKRVRKLEAQLNQQRLC